MNVDYFTLLKIREEAQSKAIQTVRGSDGQLYYTIDSLMQHAREAEAHKERARLEKALETPDNPPSATTTTKRL